MPMLQASPHEDAGANDSTETCADDVAQTNLDENEVGRPLADSVSRRAQI